MVVGGSAEYVGAPYYAAKTAMRCGIDIVYVACFEEALIPLKVLLPEAIITSLDSPDFDFERYISRCDAVLIGSGYGRTSKAAEVLQRCMECCKASKTPLVIDGDGLWHLANEIKQKKFVLQDYDSRLVLTPNAHEFKGLTHAWGTEDATDVLGIHHWLIRKGNEDIIISKCGGTVVCNEESAWRRCGGQGDMLAGAVCAVLGLTHAKKRRNEGFAHFEEADSGIYWACAWVRRCARKAEPQPGLIASDILKAMETCHFIDMK